VIVLRFLRTVLGWVWIFTDTMTRRSASGSRRERDAERLIRAGRGASARRGAQVIVWRDAELEPQPSYVFVSNHLVSGRPRHHLVADTAALHRQAGADVHPALWLAARRMGHCFIDRKDRRGATKAIRDRFARGLRAHRVLLR